MYPMLVKQCHGKTQEKLMVHLRALDLSNEIRILLFCICSYIRVRIVVDRGTGEDGWCDKRCHKITQLFWFAY